MTQHILFKSLLWLTVISLGIWVGGTFFHIVVVQPMWSYDPPASVRFFFRETRFNETIWNFFGPPWMVARILPLLLCIVVGWNTSPGNRWLLVTAGVCWIGITLYTVLYIYPINDVLFKQAGGDNPPAVIRDMVSKWLFADRLRFVIGTVGYLCVLRIFSRSH